MNNGFWGKLARPIVGLSPMDGVTDAPMRFISKKYGQPDVIYTEFVSVEGLWRIHKRGETTSKIWRDLRFDPSEKPVVAQLFGSDPDSFYEATKIVAKMGFDGIDINMGCPSPGLEKRGGGAGLMRDFGLAHRVIEAVRKGVDDCFLDSNLAKCSAHAYLSRPDEVGTRMDMLRADSAGDSASYENNQCIPVSVKTRTGSRAPDPLWWKFLAGEELPVVAMHGRTFKQLYSGKADWDILKQAAEMIKESGALFLGNGEVKKISSMDCGSKVTKCRAHAYLSRPDEVGTRMDMLCADLVGPSAPISTRSLLVGGGDLEAKVSLDPFDGVLIGRAAIGNPWALRKDGYVPSVEEKLRVAVEHAREFEKNLPGNKFEPMRKHLTWYAHGFDGAGGLRRKLVQTNSADEVEEVVENFRKNC